MAVAGDDGRLRCPWAAGPLMASYHDEEWGVPVHDDRHHLELLTLEGAQAGLSWRTVLERREGYRRAFHGFDPPAVAAMGPEEIDVLMGDASVIRNRSKLDSVATNAKALLEVAAEFSSFDAYLWGFAGGETINNCFETPAEVPSETPLSKALSADLRRRGFRFVGPTICYAYLQSGGIVNDHLVGCFRG